MATGMTTIFANPATTLNVRPVSWVQGALLANPVRSCRGVCAWIVAHYTCSRMEMPVRVALQVVRYAAICLRAQHATLISI